MSRKPRRYHNAGAAVAFSSSLPRSSFPNAAAIHSPLISRCLHCNYQVRIGVTLQGGTSVFSARVTGHHFREAVIKTKLANILPNQEESDGAFDVGVACIC
jgi:hypothetical protein